MWRDKGGEIQAVAFSTSESMLPNDERRRSLLTLTTGKEEELSPHAYAPITRECCKVSLCLALYISNLILDCSDKDRGSRGLPVVLWGELRISSPDISFAPYMGLVVSQIKESVVEPSMLIDIQGE